MLTTEEILNDLNGGVPSTAFKVLPCTLKEFPALDSQALMLLQILKCHEPSTYSHSIQTAQLTCLISNELGNSIYEKKESLEAALFHDIGKLMIPHSILNKPSKLTKEEYHKIQQHPQWGYQLLEGNKNLSQAVKLTCLYHHERIDGSGYPSGLYSSIDIINCIAVCDVFQALLSARSYKKVFSVNEAIAAVKNQALDPKYVELVESLLRSKVNSSSPLL